ncbi:hypothetical protein QWY28_13930 [Nocardioides sp. SOB77]|uniref:Lipoprotein LpqB beta-propeller domain-containing protein n=1 Tax=Nocardioides oceani TaxID=3058369 RepID=A0ABT8FHM6_9ACTN|nr:hypothetical protein [Nocardioides oceani]MDN4174056.1 hypothetical protein [Nocardioides oceani]
MSPLRTPRRSAVLATTAATAATALTALAALAALLVPASATPASSSAPAPAPVQIRPAALDRGADPAFPVLVGRTIVDGERKLRVDLPGVWLLGRSGGAYVVGFTSGGPQQQRIARLRPDGSRRTLVGDLGWDEARLSVDGDHVVLERVTVSADRRRTTLRVVDARSGELLAQRILPGVRDVLTADGGVAVVAGDGPRPTVRWDFTAGSASSDVTAGSVRTVTARDAYVADLAADRMAVFTRDPYEGGCSVVTSISEPGRTLWRSCDWRVEAVAPGGGRVAVVPLLSDGLGASAVQVRAVRGRLLAAYDVSGWFGPSRFESATSVVLDAHGTRRSALVRCGGTDGTDCERASRTTRTRHH